MSVPPITVKEAIENWITRQWEFNKVDAKKAYERAVAKDPSLEYEEPGKPVPAEQEDCRLFGGGNGVLPPIAKMDKDLQSLKACVTLRLSSNSIEKIGPGLSTLQHLRILSLGRNKIKKLENLDLPNLEELWISYNNIDKLSGLDKLRSLSVLYMSNNLVAKWTEVEKLTNNSRLTDLLMINNPVYEDTVSGDGVPEWRLQLLTRLPTLSKIDGQPVEPEERDEAEKRRGQI
eukprot:TRINITY_DN21877_c0_g1_i1.p1 TRINITY_DN21877_c0_g1~~TRINITY_DN21877_c0_g1_i1.p1  ORF type:complete len:261 (+),score=113.10 TRINITY_DN21877_c0_g1_i1:90-785(+)